LKTKQPEIPECVRQITCECELARNAHKLPQSRSTSFKLFTISLFINAATHILYYLRPAYKSTKSYMQVIHTCSQDNLPIKTKSI